MHRTAIQSQMLLRQTGVKLDQKYNTQVADRFWPKPERSPDRLNTAEGENYL